MRKQEELGQLATDCVSSAFPLSQVIVNNDWGDWQTGLLFVCCPPPTPQEHDSIAPHPRESGLGHMTFFGQ